MPKLKENLSEPDGATSGRILTMDPNISARRALPFEIARLSDNCPSGQAKRERNVTRRPCMTDSFPTP